jgi:hypothetical protein
MSPSDVPRSKASPEVMERVMFQAFPRGLEQIEQEIDQLHEHLQGKLDDKETIGRILFLIKVQLVVQPGCPESEVIPIVMEITGGKLTEEDAHDVYVFITGGSGSTATGGDGSSMDNAVVINVKASGAGIAIEYGYVSQICGKRGVDYTLDGQRHVPKNGRQYDVLTVTLLKDGSKREFWFDITSFFGRF